MCPIARNFPTFYICCYSLSIISKINSKPSHCFGARIFSQASMGLGNRTLSYCGTSFDYIKLLQSVLDGYNGTIMAYGQTGTGKTYTLGRLGEEDTAARGIMVRAMEDIFADVSLESDSVSVSYLQVLRNKRDFGMSF